jgi:plasmid maintenance system antidote protein VapI
MAKRQIPLALPDEIVAGKLSITADAAARLGIFFSMESEFGLTLQGHSDRAITREAPAGNLAAAA